MKLNAVSQLDGTIAVAIVVGNVEIEGVVRLGVGREPNSREFERGGVIQNPDLQTGAISVVISLPEHV